MKKILIVFALTLMVSIPSVKEINAYKDYGSDLLIMEDSVDSFSTAPSLRHR